MTTVTSATAECLQRRVENRGSFQTELKFAELAGDLLPADESFLSVHGKNLSQSGIAFIAPRWIRNRDIVLKLRTKNEHAAVMQARVVRCERLASDCEEYYVGCEFVDEVR